MLIVMVGLDGAGKSTQVALLHATLQATGHAVRVTDKWQILDRRAHPECRFISTDLSDLQVCISEMDGPARAYFLFWCISLTTHRQIGEDPNVVVLADGYWMKHAAAELAYGCPPTVVESVRSSVPHPDLVFFLDVSPETALRRKLAKGLTPYECGRDMFKNHASFLQHQSAVRAILRSWAYEYGWITLDAELPQSEIERSIRTALHSRGVLN